MKNLLFLMVIFTAFTAFAAEKSLAPDVATPDAPAPATPAQTDKAPTQQLQADIMARFAAVHSIYSKFTQEKRMALLSEPVSSDGVFAFQKDPGLIRWEYTAPFNNGFILGKDKTFRLDNGIKTPIKGVMARNIAAQMLLWLTFDLKELSKTYNLAYFEDGVNLTPKSEENRMLEKITVWFSPKNPQALAKIEMQEPGGDTTTLLFKDTQINQPLAEGTFE